MGISPFIKQGLDESDILLLAPFLKSQKRDTMKALELSLHMLDKVQQHPEYAAEFTIKGENAMHEAQITTERSAAE